MAWNPFDKSAAEAPTTELPPVDVPVADATAIVPPVPAPQSENLRRAFEAAQREVDDAAPEASASAVPQASVPEASAPAPLRFGGATRFGAQDESVPAPPEPAPSVPEPAPSVWAAAAASVLPTEEPTQVMPAPARAAVGPTDDAVTAEQASLERERAARREARRAALQPVTEDDPFGRAGGANGSSSVTGCGAPRGAQSGAAAGHRGRPVGPPRPPKRRRRSPSST